jgi:hypothetical protein
VTLERLDLAAVARERETGEKVVRNYDRICITELCC